MPQHHSLTESITVDRPVADCYRYLLDFSTVEQWDPAVLGARKLTPGRIEPGSRFEVVLDTGTGPATMTYALTAAEPDAQLELRGTGTSFRAVDTIRFTADGSAHTRIDYSLDVELDAAPGWAGPMLRWWLRRVARRSMAGLFTALQTPGPAPAATWSERASDFLVAPALRNFTRRGYRRLPDKGLSQRLDGRVVVITGPTAGLGLAGACELARLGATLVLVGRDPDRLQETLRTVADFADGDAGRHQIVAAELTELDQVRRAAGSIRDRHPRIDVLINNAGALFHDWAATVDGFERTLAINLLTPWLLTHELADSLRQPGSRVINVASGGMYLQALHLEDMNFRAQAFDGAKAYARAKRALVSAGDWLNGSGRLGGATVFAMHPGWAATPGVARSLPEFNRKLGNRLRSPRMGADTVVWLASSPALNGHIGGFWFDRRPHATAVLPRTAVTSQDQRRLAGWLDKATGTGDS